MKGLLTAFLNFFGGEMNPWKCVSIVLCTLFVCITVFSVIAKFIDGPEPFPPPPTDVLAQRIRQIGTHGGNIESKKELIGQVTHDHYSTERAKLIAANDEKEETKKRRR